MSRLKAAGSLMIAGALAFAPVGCGLEPPPQEEPKVDLAAEEQAVGQINAKWLELYEARNAEGIGDLFVEDGWTLNASEGLADGRNAVVAAIREGFEKAPEATANWGTKRIWVAASGDLAVERGWFAADEDGPGDAEEIKGEYLTVFIKVDGQWRVLADTGAPLGGTGDQD